MQTNGIDERLEMQHLIDEKESEEEDAEVDSQPIQIRKSKRCPYVGITMAAISAIFFFLASVIVKLMVNVHPVQLAACRSLGIVLPAIPIVIWRNESPFPKGKRLILLLRAFFGAGGMMLSFYAFRHMPLGDATVLVFSFPVFVAIFARLFLKEPCGLFHVFTIFLTMFGIILITRPSFIFGPTLSSDQMLGETVLWGPVAAITSTLFFANSYIVLRALKGIHFSVVMVNFGAFSLLVNLITTWGLGNLCWPQCGTERFLTVVVGLLSFGGQVLVTLALRFEEAGPVSIARSTDIVMAFLWQILFFNEIPNRYSITGALLVTTSVFLYTIRTWVLALPDTSLRRQMFCIFEK